MGLRGPDDKNQACYQPIEMKFCVSHCSHKSIPGPKFESGSFFSFALQNFPLKKGTSYRIRIFTPWKINLNFKK